MTRQFKPGQLQTGSLYNISSSYAVTASYAANAGVSIDTGSFATTGSNIFIGNQTITGSLLISGSTTQIGTNNLLGQTNLSGSIYISGSVNALADMTLAGTLRLDLAQDPGNSNVTASFLFTSASNTATGFDLYYRQNDNLVKFKWLEGGISTGLLYGGVVSGSGTTIYVSSGSGIIMNANATLNKEVAPYFTYVTWPAYSASATYLTSSQNTYLYVDDTGIVRQQSTYFAETQYQEAICLGRVTHANYSSITGIGSNVQTTYDSDAQQNEFIRAFGPLKISGLTITGQPGSLRFNVGAGQSYNLGGFYPQNPNHPSGYSSAAFVTASIARARLSGSNVILDNNAGAFYTVIDPTKYDTGNGTLQNVPGGSYSIQRVFINPVSGRTTVYYGQAIYNNLAVALQSLNTDPFTEGVFTSKALVFAGYLVIKSGTTDLTDTGDCQIIQAGIFRNTAGGSSTSGTITLTLDNLSDVTTSTPSNGQALVYNSGTWVNGTPSLATTASYVLNAVSASYAPPAFPYTGSALITGSLGVTGSASILAYTASADSIFTVRNSANSANLFRISGDSTAAFGNTIYSNVGLTLTSTKQYNGYFEGGTTGIYVANNSSANTSKGIETLSRINNLAGSGVSSTGVTTTADGGSTTSAHYGLRANAYGSGINYAGYFDVVNGVNNYAIVTQRGFSGFGQTAPAAMVDIKAAGALSTDLALRIRNSADNDNILTVKGDMSIQLLGSGSGGYLNLSRPAGAGANVRLTHRGTATLPSNFIIGSYGDGGSIGQIILDAFAGDGTTPTFTTQRLISGMSDLSGSALYTGFGSAAATFVMKNALNYVGYGTIPTGTATDHFAMYSADINGANGTASPNFRTEDGSVLWLGTNSKLFNVTASNMMVGSTSSLALFTSVNSTVNVGTTTLYAVPTASYDGVFIDYTARSGSNARAGQLMGIWSGSAVNYTETTTTDFGSTTAITFGMSISSSSMIVSASATTAAWTVKTIIRSM